MQKYLTASTISAFSVGILIGGFVTQTVIVNTSQSHGEYPHPIADPLSDEYHVHADFRIFIDDTQVDLSDEMFMTTATNKLSDNAHLHDGNGEVKHIHDTGVTFSAFLSALDIELGDDCLQVFEEDERCSDSEEELLLFVNGESYQEAFSEYEPIDDDSILLYYGNPQNENIQTYIDEIPDDSCYYSGTCPERGVAPPESCGLTCEL